MLKKIQISPLLFPIWRLENGTPIVVILCTDVVLRKAVTHQLRMLTTITTWRTAITLMMGWRHLPPTSNWHCQNLSIQLFTVSWHRPITDDRPRRQLSWHSTTPTPTPTSSWGSSRECRRVVKLATGITSGNHACRTFGRVGGDPREDVRVGVVEFQL